MNGIRNERCPISSASQPEQEHHLARKANDPGLTVWLSRRPHELQTEWQYGLGMIRRETAAEREHGHGEIEKTWAIGLGLMLVLIAARGFDKAVAPRLELIGQTVTALASEAEGKAGEPARFGPQPLRNDVRGLTSRGRRTERKPDVAEVLRLTARVGEWMGAGDQDCGALRTHADVIASFLAHLDTFATDEDEAAAWRLARNVEQAYLSLLRAPGNTAAAEAAGQYITEIGTRALAMVLAAANAEGEQAQLAILRSFLAESLSVPLPTAVGTADAA